MAGADAGLRTGDLKTGLDWLEMSMAFTNPEFLVSTDWLAEHLAGDDVRVFETTVFLRPRYGGGYRIESGRGEYEAEHVPGAGFLIEIKTDMCSRREGQQEYLSRARERRMVCILSELKEIAKASKSRKKYFHLLNALSEMGLMGLPRELEEMMLSENIRGSTKLIGEIDVRHSTDSQIEVIFVQPKKDGAGARRGFQCISFHKFAKSIKSSGELGYLLARYLRRWKADAGMWPPKHA